MSTLRMSREQADRYVNRPARSVAIERSIIQDSSLSHQARFLYCLMRSHDGWVGQDGEPWRFRDQDLMRKSGWSRRETLYRYRTELVEAGLVVKVQLANDQGQFQGVLWEVLADYPEPESAKTGVRDDRTPQKPESGKSGLRHQIRKNPIQGFINTPLTPHGGETAPTDFVLNPSHEPDGLDEHDDGQGETASPKQESAQSGLECPARPVSSASGSTTYPDGFEAVWRAYRKGSGSKRSAYRAWVRARRDYPELDLLGAVERFVRLKEQDDARSCGRGETPQERKRFWKDLSTWLNQCCWEDLADEEQSPAAEVGGNEPWRNRSPFTPEEDEAERIRQERWWNSLTPEQQKRLS